ncbi:MAG TPA: hypothetical protein VFR78_15465 [Pyrinomonadaceae bacterium]|nr:hypothetical protein [Pyrinomonadaceae bacterium]
MKTSEHVSLETLVDIAEHRLKGDNLEAAMDHVSTCSVCDDTLHRLEQLIGTMKTDTSQDPPRDVLMSALSMFEQRTRPSLRHIIATLIFDSRNAGPAFGMRSLQSASRQLLYSAGGTDVDLRVTVQKDECLVAGQVIRDACATGVVEISGANATAGATLNDLCEFTLPSVPLGSYELKLRLPDIEIEIPELDLND